VFPICVILTAVSVIVAGSLGGSRGNLAPKNTSSASALHQVDASTQVSTSILRYLQLNEKVCVLVYTEIYSLSVAVTISGWRYLKCSVSENEHP
jgi:hypothetical protein